jgi:hypothetical protein
MISHTWFLASTIHLGRLIRSGRREVFTIDGSG